MNKILIKLLLLSLVTVFVLPTNASAQNENDFEVIDFARDRKIPVEAAQKRLSWQSEAYPLQNEAKKAFGTNFGGVWIDENDGDRVKLGISVKAKNLLGSGYTILKRCGLGEGADVTFVNHSWDELTSASNLINDQARALGSADRKQRLAAGIVTGLNVVELRIPVGSLSEDEAALVESAEQKFGDALTVSIYEREYEPKVCSYPNCDPPLRGGLQIRDLDKSPGIGCTAGFITKSRVDNKKYVLTAGHCLGAGNPSDYWSAFTPTYYWKDIGQVHNWEYYPQWEDSGIFRINDTTFWNPRGWVYVTASDDTTKNETYKISSTGSPVWGQRICTSGAVSGISDCGTVSSVGVSEGIVFYVDGINARNGDSGAPLYASHRAYGILNGTLDTATVCQEYWYAAYRMNVDAILEQ
jgi:hypothetical protein